MEQRVKTEKQMFKEWSKMDREEKSKWNGYKGFLQGIRFMDSSLFLTQRQRKQRLKKEEK